MKKLYTENDIVDLIRQGARVINVAPETLFTPSALDKARDAKIKIIRNKDVEKVEAAKSEKQLFKKVALGCDHTGLELKSVLINHLKSKSFEITDVGTYSSDSCDYPDFAIKVAEQVLSGKVEFGIMIDATGIPSSITVNKLPGIRGATCYNEFTAKSAREHNNANIMVLGAKAIGEETAKSIIDKWIVTKFAGGRHQRRLDKIIQLEESLLKKK